MINQRNLKELVNSYLDGETNFLNLTNQDDLALHNIILNTINLAEQMLVRRWNNISHDLLKYLKHNQNLNQNKKHDKGDLGLIVYYIQNTQTGEECITLKYDNEVLPFLTSYAIQEKAIIYTDLRLFHPDYQKESFIKIDNMGMIQEVIKVIGDSS